MGEKMSPNVKETFGELLRRYRLGAGLSQESLAERAGLSADAISYLERGRRTAPRPETLTALATALGLAQAERAYFIAAGFQRVTTGPQGAAHALRDATVAAHDGTSGARGAELEQLSVLPVALTPLVGRECEEAAVAHLLRQGGLRLLTLTGPGGVGKTRLAVQVAASVRDAFADGVVFVALAPLHDSSLVLTAIAQAFGLREAGARPLHETVMAALQAHETLLLLDNFEHVLAAAPLVGELLAACPRLRVLVTSRAVLRVQGEHEFAVPPLAIPEAVERAAVERVAQSPAVALFLQRARAAKPDFVLNTANAPDVADVCAYLDGLPLAIELAAARSKLFSPHALLGRLMAPGGALRMLAHGARDLPARQQTVRAAIDWSYSLLPPQEQTLFRCLSVFAAGCTIDAVEHICVTRQVDVLAGLTALLDNSLLRRDDGSGDEPRLSLLETNRAYALEQLEANGEDETIQQAHATYYLTLAEAATPYFSRPEQTIWLDRLEREHANLRLALAWAWERRHGEIGLRLVAALWQFWYIRGYQSEGRAWLERFLGLDGGSHAAPGAVRAEALTGAAWLAHLRHEYAAAIPLLEESLHLRDALGLPDGLTDLLIHRALLARAEGDYEQAIHLLEESVARHRTLGNHESLGARGLGLSLSYLGMTCREHGDLARATPLYAECLALHQELGDREGAAFALLGLGDIARDRGDASGVHAYCDQSYAIFAELGDKRGMVASLHNLAVAMYGQGDLELAEVVAERCVALARDLGSEPVLAEDLLTLSWIAAARGGSERAAAALAESLTLMQDRGPRFLLPSALETLAVLAAGEQQMLFAARLLGAAANLRDAIGAPRPIFFQAAQQHTHSATHAALEPMAFSAAWDAGAAWPLDQAVDASLTYLKVKRGS